MGQEIERKFLVRADSWREEVDRVTHMVQGYLPTSQGVTVRVRIAGERAFLTIKGATSGISRAEFEYAIPVVDAEQILSTLAGPGVIDKQRHVVTHAGRRWEVDVFAGDNEGLVLAEVELESADDVVDLPDWAGAEVSDDPRYFNVALSSRPYTTW